jgi:hypothetical protein
MLYSGYIFAAPHKAYANCSSNGTCGTTSEATACRIGTFTIDEYVVLSTVKVNLSLCPPRLYTITGLASSIQKGGSKPGSQSFSLFVTTWFPVLATVIFMCFTHLSNKNKKRKHQKDYQKRRRSAKHSHRKLQLQQQLHCILNFQSS